MATGAGHVDGDEPLPELSLSHLRPFFSITILECVVDEIDLAYSILVRYLRKCAEDKGRALTSELIGETIIGGPDDTRDDGSDAGLHDLGFDRLYAIARRRRQPPSWATKDSQIVDTVNELTLALRRSRLIAIRSDIIDTEKLLRWADAPKTPCKPLLPEILQGTFDGDGKMIWTQGVHRQRASKPNSKAVSGTRLQDAYDAGEDFSYALTAMRLDFVPERSDTVLHGALTVSPEKSHLSSKAMPNFPMFIAATEEALSMIEKSISAESPPEPTLPGYATREKDLTKVYGAYDIRIASPEEIYADPEHDQGDHERAQLLRESVLDVSGNMISASAIVDVGRNGSVCGQLVIRPTPTRSGFNLSVGLTGTPTDERRVRAVKNALENGDLVSIYYQSGHAFTARQISKQNLHAPPFANIRFENFSEYSILHEKPQALGNEAIHEMIGLYGDNSIFAWVVHYFCTGWLICDDGAGEIADFLHLDEDGTLSAIHVKAAHNSSPHRKIAVTAFEELVSQAEKNIKRLQDGLLLAELRSGRI
jgi:hypothetical protein